MACVVGVRSREKLVSRAEIERSVWGEELGPSSNVVDVYVRYLREKIDRPFGTESIETVRGVGYRFRE